MINLFQGESINFLMQVIDTDGNPLDCSNYDFEIFLRQTTDKYIYKWPAKEVKLSEDNYLFFSLSPKISEALDPGRYVLEVNVKKDQAVYVTRLCKSINVDYCVISHI